MTLKIIRWFGLDFLGRRKRMQTDDEQKLRHSYNDAVYNFNRHPGFSLYKKLTNHRLSIQFKMDRLNSTLANPYQWAQQKDQQKQKQDFLANFLIASKGLGLVLYKKKLLIDLGILTLADFASFNERVKGIGGKSLNLIYQYINEVSQDFKYHPDHVFIKAQIGKIKKNGPVIKSRLTANLNTIESKITSICKELHEANDKIDSAFETSLHKYAKLERNGR